MVVLDTDHITFLERARGAEFERLSGRLETSGQTAVATTIVTYEEQTRGWLSFVAKARTVAKLVEAYGFLLRHLNVYRPIQVLPFDEAAAVQYQNLSRSRVAVGVMDLRIAAIVLVNDATLLTRNLRDFRKVPGLKVEDWTV